MTSFRDFFIGKLKVLYTEVSKSIGKKVDKIDGKGLSEVDVTPTMRDTWNDAQPNVIESIKVRKKSDTAGSGVVVTPDDSKTVEIVIPNSLSEMTNDLTGDNELLTVKFYKDQIGPAISAAVAGSLQKIVCLDGVLPENPLESAIYLVPKSTTDANGNTVIPEGTNIYDEYVLVTTTKTVNGVEQTTKSMEKLGDTEIDLSGYVKFSSVTTTKITAKQVTDMMDKVDAATS